MTERWRKKLEGIDGASPSDDVFERAKQGPMHRDEALPGPRMSARVVTIVAAFLVFALAISVFAIPALRMNNTPASGTGSGLMPLWPSQSSDQLQQLQEDADAGNADWALDPELLARKFAQEVMGWPSAVAKGQPAPYCYVVPEASGGPSPVSCPDLPVGGYSVAAGIPTALFSAEPSPAGGPFTTYAVFRCLECPTREFVQVYQPLVQGDGGIWAVLQAQGTETLSVLPGQVVHDGSSVSSGFLTYGRFVPTLGYGSCGQSSASSTFHAPPGSDSAGILSNVHLTGGCDGEQPGYVWAAIATSSLADTGSGVVDPFNGGTAELESLTAAPVTMVFPTAAAETTQPTSPTSEQTSSPSIEPSSWTTFDGGLGFTMELPSDWGTTSVIDEIVVNAPGGDPYIQINRVEAHRRDDSSFPLNFADYEGDNQPHFYGDGQAFIIQWLTGTADPLTPEQSAVVERIVESIRFQPWHVGETRNGFTGVAKILPAASAEWVTFEGGHYIASLSAGGARQLLGPAPTCSGATYEVRETGVAGISCGDGSGGDWNFETGEPAPGNPAPFDRSLDVYEAIRSWDGFLLARLT